ncbi:gp174 [Sphingomonas phage PAU]|uniref:gp174 n=1 Tax=Sphingomonas phage PAU TaxID=1150991 RepID=UPI00025732FA|nr:gp174 [Sphingomonas phage PAU]AFF28172.1 gp174 [Sphingomonas phage PAU]
MVLEFVYNFSLLRVVSATKEEHEQLMLIATGQNYNFQTKSYWEECFYKNYEYLPAGMWKRVLELNRAKNPWHVHITNLNDFVRTDITKEKLQEWVDSQNLIYDPYYYQADAFFKLIKFPRSKAEIGTGGGKTFTACLLARYYLQNILEPGQKVLIVVPRRALVDQFLSDLKKYCDDGYLIIDSEYSGGRNYANSNVIVGTFQTLSNYEASFFEDIGCAIFDEAHTAKTRSIKEEIIPKLPWAKCRSFHGMTGTEPDDEIGKLILECYIGPTLQFTPTSELEEAGSIVPTKVLMVGIKHTRKTAELYYTSPETSEPNQKRIAFEKQVVLYNEERLAFIAEILNKLQKSTLMLFNTVEYARYMMDHLNHNSHKKIRLIYGATPDAERQRIFEELENHDDIILLATFGTMSTGISIDNIHNLATADGGKSTIIINQSIGRGVRLHKDKEFLRYIDFYDIIPKYDPDWGGPRTNVFQRQSDARRKIYDKRKTEHKTKIVELKS